MKKNGRWEKRGRQRDVVWGVGLAAGLRRSRQKAPGWLAAKSRRASRIAAVATKRGCLERNVTVACMTLKAERESNESSSLWTGNCSGWGAVRICVTKVKMDVGI